MSISTTSLFLKPVCQAEVDPPVPASTRYTMFLPSGTPLATIARAKPQEGALGFSWAVDQDLSQPDMAYQHNQADLERMHSASSAGKSDSLPQDLLEVIGGMAASVALAVGAFALGVRRDRQARRGRTRTPRC